MSRKLDKPKTRLLNILVTAEEEAFIRENADKYAGGNYSAWMRYASITCIPAAKDLKPKKS